MEEKEQEKILSQQFMLKQMIINQNFQEEIENNYQAIKALQEKYNSLNESKKDSNTQTDTGNHKGFFRRFFRWNRFLMN